MLKITKILIILLFITINNLCSQIIVPLQYIDLKAEAEVLFKSNQYQDALSKYLEIIKGDYVRRIDYAYIAKCCVELGQEELAKKYFQKSLDEGLHFNNISDTIYCYDTTANYYLDYLILDNWADERNIIIENTKKYFEVYAKDKETANKLIIRMKVDQKMEAFAKKYPNLDSVSYTKIDIRKENQIDLQKIIDNKGFPTISKVGSDGCFAAFTIIQNSSHSIDFQKYCLKLMIEEYKTGEIPPSYIAILQDKILISEGKKQIFGTQINEKSKKLKMEPVLDKEKLQSRQEVMQLEK